AKALKKVRKVNSRRKENTDQSRQLGPEDTFFVKDGEKCWFITLSEVRYFQTMGNYAQIHFGSEKTLIQSSLNSLEKRLSPRTFFRANRQVIINLKYVENIKPWHNGGLRVYFPEDKTFDISRRQAAKLTNLLGL